MLDELKKDWKEAGEQSKSSRVKDREAREDKRRRESFTGKYSGLFYRIFWKNFLYSWKDYALFVICSIMICAVTFTLLGCYQSLSELHSDEGTLVLFGTIGEGIQRILVNAMFPLGICTIFLLIYVLLFYLKKRMLSYGMLVTLGIRRKALHTAIVIEIGIGIMLSMICGCLLGNVLILLIHRGMCLLLEETIIFSPVAGKIYCGTIFIIIVIYVLTLLGMFFVTDFNPISASARIVQSERLPEKRLKLFIILGAVFIAGSWILYTQIWNFEKVSLIGVFSIGLYLILRYGGADYLRKQKRGKKYLERLMDRNYLYHKSSTTAKYLTGLIIIHLCAVFYFAFPMISSIVSEDPENLFPYDFMCMADDGDDAFFQELEDKYGAEIISYPMVRVVSVDKTQEVKAFERLLPQGQNIGISETTYHELKKALDTDYQARLLGLDENGEKICIVHQQDQSVKAQPIDWRNTKINPYIHIGLPCEEFDINSFYLDYVFPNRKVIKDEIGSLTGCYRRGLLENIVVFSDEYFQEAQELWKDTYIKDGYSIQMSYEKYGWPEAIPGETILQGPTKLVLINVDEKYIDSITQEMKQLLEEEHYEDFELYYDSEINCWYSSKEAIQDIKSERIMKAIVNGFVIVVLAVTGIIFLLIKMLSELDEKKERSVFLDRMGMRRKDRIHLLKKEIYLFYQVPFVITTIGAILFSAATFYVRRYTTEIIKQYLIRGILVWAIYFMIQWIFVWMLSKFIIRKVEDKNERKSFYKKGNY